MKNLVYVAFCLFAVATSNAQSKIPVEVKNVFAKQYPTVKKVKWDKENKNFEASYTADGIKKSVLFDDKGNILETEKSINPNQLAKEIMEFVAKKYPNQKVKGAAQINSASEGLIYEVEVKGKDLLFDKNNKFIRETKD